MSAYLDLILLMVVVVLIYVRLNKVLGTRPEEDNVQKTTVKFQRIGDNVILFTDKPEEEAKNEPQTPMDKTLSSIPGFSKDDFCQRCSKVFEMVLNAFATADIKTLKMLSGKKLYDKFQEIIKHRQEEGITAETDLIRIEDLSIEDASVSSKGVAHIVVKFISEQVNLLKNAAGEVIEGDENFVQKITDFWTFEKNINSNSPVWFLVSTKKTGHS